MRLILNTTQAPIQILSWQIAFWDRIQRIPCHFSPTPLLSPGNRGVAQPGSVLAWGASGRRFKSFRPDQ